MFVLILLSIIGLWVKGGFSKVTEVMSPFNVLNYVVTVALLLPAIGAHVLADRLSKRASSPDRSE